MPKYTIDDIGIGNAPADQLLKTPAEMSGFDDGIAPFAIGAGEISEELTLQEKAVLRSGQTAYDTGTGFWLEANSGTPRFSIGNSSANKLTWDGTTLSIAGAFSASTIDIGGADASSFHVDIDGNMWLGAATFAASGAKISNAGAATFSSVTITGGSISSTPISSIPNNSSTDISLLEKTWTMTFSVTDANTVAWSSGTITLSNGRTFSISAGNTGNMAALTYIYLDPSVSTTVLQTTTTAATAMGANKILVGCAQNNTVTASFIPYGPGQPLVDGGNIGALSIVAGNIAANTITGAKVLTLDLTSKTITADTGTIGGWKLGASTLYSITGTGGIVLNSGASAITLGANSEIAGYINMGAASAPLTGTGVYLGYDQSGDYTFDFRAGNPSGVYMHWDDSAGTLGINGGSLNVGTTGNVRGGSTDYLTGTGFFLGYSGAAHKFSVGNPSGNYIAWNGSAFVVNGFTLTNQGTFGGDGSDGALSITSGTTTLSAASASTLVKNYSSISITSTAKLAFSNPHSGGTIVTLKSQGAVTLSSTQPAIDTRSMGAAGGDSATGQSGTAPNALLLNTNIPEGSAASAGTGGAAGSRYDTPNFYTTSEALLSRRYVAAICGAGGGSGVQVDGGDGSDGGRGGGALIIECNGALNFSGTINSSGSAGQNAVAATGVNEGGGGGGGGSAGMVVILYNTLTANTGTITSSGGAGGNGATALGTGGGPAGGGGGAGSVSAAGGAGGGVATNGSAAAGAGGGGGGGGGDNNGGGGPGTGGAGGSSMSGLVAKNYYFA